MVERAFEHRIARGSLRKNKEAQRNQVGSGCKRALNPVLRRTRESQRNPANVSTKERKEPRKLALYIS